MNPTACLNSKLQLSFLRDNGVKMAWKRRTFISLIFIINCITKCSLIRYVNTVKPVLSGHPWDLRYCPLNRGVRLVQVHFTENKGRKLRLYRGWCV